MPVKIIEVKPHRGGWKVFESLGVEPFFLRLDQAIGYAKTRQGFGQGEIRILDAKGNTTETFRFDDTGRRL